MYKVSYSPETMRNTHSKSTNIPKKDSMYKVSYSPETMRNTHSKSANIPKKDPMYKDELLI